MPASPLVRTALVVCVCLLLSACASSGLSLGNASVPSGGPVQLDGVMDAAEWRAAHSQPLAGDGLLFLMTRDDALHVGVRGRPEGLGHVYLVIGDTVHVFHASGALGTAAYVRQGQTWEPVREFEWDVRGRQMTPELIAQQEAHYEREGWVASTTGMGVFTDMEFRLSLDLVRQSDAIAVAYATGPGPGTVQHAPLALSDATVLPDLLSGNTPGALQFLPDQWMPIRAPRP